jgi:diguanylate cyclase (GGDEF)-like protein/PAS domain S-box-containing protein
LQSLIQQSGRAEIDRRIQIETNTFKGTITQHLDASRSFSSFILGETLAHAYIEADEASGFIRGSLRIHPNELLALAILPPQEHGDRVLMTAQETSVKNLDPPLASAWLKQVADDHIRAVIVRNAEGRHIMRVGVAVPSEYGAGYAVADWDIVSMLEASQKSLGETGLELQIESSMDRARIPLIRTGWVSTTAQSGASVVDFSQAGLAFRLTIRPSAALLKQMRSSLPVWILLLSLGLTGLATWLIFNRSRYAESLELEVGARTQDLEAQQHELAAVVDHHADAMLMLDNHGAVLRANPAACMLFGYQADEWMKLSVHDLIPADIAKQYPQWFAEEPSGKRHDSMGKRRELRGRKRDGTIFPVEVTVNEYVANGQQRLSIIAHDLSGEKKAQSHIQRLANAVQHSSDIYFSTDADGMVTEVNAAVLSLLGLKKAQILGEPFSRFVDPEYKNYTQAVFAAKARGEANEHRYELVIRDARGVAHWMDVLTQAMREAGVFMGVQGFAREITEQKQREWIRDAMLELRYIEQRSIPLEEKLAAMLNNICNDPWGLVRQAALFLADGEQLRLKASWHMSEEEKQRCSTGQGVAGDISICSAGGTVEHNRAQFDQEGSGNIFLPVMFSGNKLGVMNIALYPEYEIPDTLRFFYEDAAKWIGDTVMFERQQGMLKSSEQKHRLLVDNIPLGIVIHQQGMIRFINPSAVDIFGADDENGLIGRSVLDFVSETDKDFVSKRISDVDKNGMAPGAEVRLRRINGDSFWAETQAVAVEYENSPAVQVLVQDISERKVQEEELKHLSYFDMLTNLANRRLFEDRLRQAIANAHRKKEQLTLIYFDLNRFKQVNDSFGHAAGDEVLAEIGDRLGILRDSDTAARLGGDEFAILLSNVPERSAKRVGRKIIGVLQQPFCVAGQELSIDASVGIAVYPNDGEDAELLMRHADAAMYHAKSTHAGIHMFSGEMEEDVRRRLKLEQELGKAVDQGELRLYYQSQHLAGVPDGVGQDSPFPLHLQSKHGVLAGSIIGVEALIRWQHPKLGLISPVEFIPLAEETGQIRAITHWALCQASKQAVIWEKSGIRPERIGVNLSAAQLMQKGLTRELLTFIREGGAKPEWIEIEITESAAMADAELAISIMRELVDAGITIAIDDFGTGYSSLAYLKRLPAEIVKIDQSFIRQLPDDEEDAAIVRSSIAMVHALGKKVIAEGVETKAQLAFLRGEGCDMIQGYLFSEPLPEDEASEFLSDNASAICHRL